MLAAAVSQRTSCLPSTLGPVKVEPAAAPIGPSSAAAALPADSAAVARGVVPKRHEKRQPDKRGSSLSTKDLSSRLSARHAQLSASTRSAAVEAAVEVASAAEAAVQLVLSDDEEMVSALAVGFPAEGQGTAGP